MAAAASRDRAVALLAAVNNHGDLAVKLSSLKQVKDILLSVEPPLAAELFPYLAELQSSPENLVRKTLVEIVEEVGFRALERSYPLLLVLLPLIRDGDPAVAKRSIISGTNFFCSILEEMSLQFIRHNKVERWLGDLWIWMAKFKDTVRAITLEPGSVGVKILALKFLETLVLIFTSDAIDFEKNSHEGSRRMFNISWLNSGHPILDPVMLMSEASRTLGFFSDLLQSTSNLPGALAVSVVHCLASIGRKRPVHYNFVLSALFDFNPNSDTRKGYHGVSVQYSVRTALLGFLRSTHPLIVESRDKLVKTLQALGAGDAADQAIRQVDKMIRNTDRGSREMWSGRDSQFSSQQHIWGDQLKKRSLPPDGEDTKNGHQVAAKRARYGLNIQMASSIPINDSRHDSVPANGSSPNFPCLEGELTPVEQMIAMIGALLAEGDRGAESLEILISKLHPDMLADIVITNMKHLPNAAPPLTRSGMLPLKQSTGLPNSTQNLASPSPAGSPFSSSNVVRSTSEVLNSSNFTMDSRRDPRRDPRRMDPRRVSASIGPASVPAPEETGGVLSGLDGSISLDKSRQNVPAEERSLAHLVVDVKYDSETKHGSPVANVDQYRDRKDVLVTHEASVPQVTTSSDHPLSHLGMVNKDLAETKISDGEKLESDALSMMDSDQLSPPAPNSAVSEEMYKELPVVPLFIELTEKRHKHVRRTAVEQIIESYKHLHGFDTSQMRMALLARLAAQIDTDDDIFMTLRDHIRVDYHQQKGHELVLHILYYLHSLVTLASDENSSVAAVAYEKFLLSVARLLLETVPASDRSFSRLLGEAPRLPDSAMKLLDDLCYADVRDPNGKEIRDGERVTQGLGAVWSLILGRPNYREACLEIALKCSVHAEDDIRAKSIRLVTNKLYPLSYISGRIEQFATEMFLSAVNQQAPETELSHSDPADEKAEPEKKNSLARNRETSTSGSDIRDSETSEMRGFRPSAGNVSALSFAEAQRLVSLYFALCKKKPRLLQLVFDVYGRAPKTVKQAFHRHTPILVRALGSSYSELLHIISDPPQGSENLLTLVLQILTQETVPSPDLIATVKHLYETKFKDVSILIPLLSSFSKSEVLPIFPRLVNLPLEKFQMALAHILQGSAHTGPALTPVEVLVAIHDIVPEKDGLPLKKIMDACTACFEQRTVFTQQVLAKALNHMVDQTPLPLLFMRTVIQAIDAFPALVDFVMEILSKLVSKQIWRLPKLWVGFLKCVSQTQPHSYPVLLKLPPPQLENTLNKYPGLRGPLAAYAKQSSLKASLPSAVVAALGLTNGQDMQSQHVSQLHASDASSSVHGANLT